MLVNKVDHKWFCRVVISRCRDEDETVARASDARTSLRMSSSRTLLDAVNSEKTVNTRSVCGAVRFGAGGVGRPVIHLADEWPPSVCQLTRATSATTKSRRDPNICLPGRFTLGHSPSRTFCPPPARRAITSLTTVTWWWYSVRFGVRVRVRVRNTVSILRVFFVVPIRTAPPGYQNYN